MSEKIETELRNVFAELGLIEAAPGDVTEDITFADLNADSLTLMDLCVALEERYEFIIEPADVMKQATLSNLARFIATRRPERA
ncbi:acyl carrier protein [Aestuariivirga sp. YIM B02566]|jgi:acyl carrier protein|uniref:Acyl carrier protein n=1 Tax=Taklimakanibacter albus TaxID=2800327 RepID=A0ACC5R5U5_9HYPH|nr:acyl carrier protein [Aestuariivirga sp. YIM B02566]MBK1867743.1 acyl carrier protein [Aestuariivirga sp. YIM B02566]